MAHGVCIFRPIHSLKRQSNTYTHRVGQKWHHLLYASQLHRRILTDLQNSFTVRIRRQFVTKLSLQIPPHLKCVATLPREISDDALKPATPLTGCVINVDRACHVSPKQSILKFSRLCCSGCPSTEGLSMLTIHDSQLAKKNHCR